MSLRIVVFIVCVLIAGSQPASPSIKKIPPVEYEVYALSYGVYPGYGVSNLVAGANKNRKIDLQMMIWLLKGPGGKNILVDSGCYHDRFVKNLGIKNYTKPSDTLARLGLSAADITDVIISHMHWDHADGMDLFPNAKIWLQKDEYVYYTGEAWQRKDTHGGIDKDDVVAVVKLNLEGRVGLVNGDAQEIIPGITCYTGGKHTYQ